MFKKLSGLADRLRKHELTESDKVFIQFITDEINLENRTYVNQPEPEAGAQVPGITIQQYQDFLLNNKPLTFRGQLIFLNDLHQQSTTKRSLAFINDFATVHQKVGQRVDSTILSKKEKKQSKKQRRLIFSRSNTAIEPGEELQPGSTNSKTEPKEELQPGATRPKKVGILPQLPQLNSKTVAVKTDPPSTRFGPGR